MTKIKMPPLPNDSETPASSEWQWSDADMQAYATAAYQAALASPEVQALRDALQVMIETAERVDGWQSFPNEPIENGRAALSAMEKQK